MKNSLLLSLLTILLLITTIYASGFNSFEQQLSEKNGLFSKSLPKENKLVREEHELFENATINIYLEKKDLAGMVTPLKNVLVKARAFSPPRLLTFFCYASSYTDEYGFCHLKVPIIKNCVMRYIVYTNPPMCIPSFASLEIEQNENKNINLQLIQIQWTYGLATINVHVTRNTNQGNIPVENAIVFAQSRFPILPLRLSGRRYQDATNKTGECSFQVLAIEENIVIYVVAAGRIRDYLSGKPTYDWNVIVRPDDIVDVYIELNES